MSFLSKSQEHRHFTVDEIHGGNNNGADCRRKLSTSEIERFCPRWPQMSGNQNGQCAGHA